MIATLKAALLSAVLMAAFSGCAAAPEPTDAAATHYWYSDTGNPKRQYNSDNTNCRQQSNADQTDSLETQSHSYQAYRDCMIENGYTLRRY